ncbi:Catalase2 [Ramazzottius varieornatus]|uniref:catalase n=1 Tax=Ramazzottius varieornatus TaxID=947166 RepID=A0A1D1UYH3_RAMVA|nr:Catalase2 [Ramazzottius varieornatus]
MINAEGVARFVKFHWIPLAGANSLLRDEARKIAGKNSDFHRIKGRKVAILAADGVDGAAALAVMSVLKAGGAMAQIVAPRMGSLKVSSGQEGEKALQVDGLVTGLPSILFDAVYLPGGKDSIQALLKMAKVLADLLLPKQKLTCIELFFAAQHYLMEAYIHCKPMAASAHTREVDTKSEQRKKTE